MQIRSGFVLWEEGESNEDIVVESNLKLRDQGFVVEPSLVSNCDLLREEVGKSLLTLLEASEFLLGSLLIVGHIKGNLKKYNHFINVGELDDTGCRDLACELGFGFSIKAREYVTYPLLFCSLLVIVHVKFDIKIGKEVLE